MKKTSFIFIFIFLFIFVSKPAFAEGFFNGYAGASIPLKVQLQDTSPSGLSLKDLDVDDSVVFGGKVGYWMENVPFLGIEMDISAWFPDIPKQQASNDTGNPKYIDTSMDVLDIGFNALARYAFNPNNRYIEPYVGLGVGIFIYNADDKTSANSDDSGTAPAFHALTGIKTRLSKNLFLFGEYKYVRAEPDFDKQQIDTDFQFNNIYFGIEYRFGNIDNIYKYISP